MTLESVVPLPVNLLSKDFDSVVSEKQNALGEKEKSSSVR